MDTHTHTQYVKVTLTFRKYYEESGELTVTRN